MATSQSGRGRSWSPTGLRGLQIVMPDYQIFGGVLRSNIDFPELAPGTALPPRWVLSKLDHLPSISFPELLGREEVEKGIEVSLSRYAGGLRLNFDDTGVFDITEDGREIAWSPPVAPDLDAVRKDLLGRVFAVALHQAGIVTLHGSAVALGGVAVAFLAPKFHGKSTTAAALVNAGGRLLADDLVPIAPGAEPMLLPSVPMVQLWKDSAERVAGGASPISGDSKAPKLQVAWTATERTAAFPVPLAAVYLLAPVRSDPTASVRRSPVTGAEAAVALLGQAKVGALLGAQRRADLLQRMADLAERVPVYRLEIPRDFDRIGELTTCLIGWHAGSVAPESAGRDG